MHSIHIYIATISQFSNKEIKHLNNAYMQITSSNNCNKLIKQKCASLNLLYYICNELKLDKDIKNYYITSNNKPKNKHFNFSISHSDELIAIAISENINVGIDIQKIKKINNLDKFLNKIINTNESISSKENNNDIINLFSRKESSFKLLNLKHFNPTTINTNDFFHTTKTIKFNNKEFILNLSTELKQENIFFHTLYNENN